MAKTSVSFSDRLVNFIQRNRKILAGILGIVVLGLIILAIGINVNEQQHAKAIEQVEGFSERYDTIRSESDETKHQEAITTLLKEVEHFASTHSGYAGGKAYSIVASIHVDRKEWLEAEKAWIAAKEKVPASYFAPVALYNAATTAEERGDIDRAIELYTEITTEYQNQNTFPLMPRVYLAIGRLEETRKNNSAAIAAYQKIVEKWPDDSWTKIANSRILYLSLSK
jgi:tetratricopeptide (TPR) repeat protein